MVFHTKALQENAVKASGLYNAQIYSNAITEFRSLYASEVIPVAVHNGIEITHDYHTRWLYYCPPRQVLY